MPISKADQARYPADWRAISLAIRGRARGRCECQGECGREHFGRCVAEQGEPAPRTGSRVVLTVAHLWRGPCAPCHEKDEKCGNPAHLAAFCQACHLLYDMPHHVKRSRATRRARKAVGDLFPMEGA